VNTVMNIMFAQRTGNLLIRLATITLSKDSAKGFYLIFIVCTRIMSM
jgi:hypothetical protein